VRSAGITPSAIARANGARRNGENSASSLPSVSTAHSPADQSPYVCGSSATPARNAALSTPARWNITDAACIASTGVATVGAPARWATSASPVASITRRARIASRPALDSTITPAIASPSITGATKVRWSIGCTPASATRRSATTLKPSESIS